MKEGMRFVKKKEDTRYDEEMKFQDGSFNETRRFGSSRTRNWYAKLKWSIIEMRTIFRRMNLR